MPDSESDVGGTTAAEETRKEPEQFTEQEQYGKRSFNWKPAPVNPAEVIEDLDLKVYCYSEVSPTDVLDLHCKAVLGIEKGIVHLPKYKTLKLGMQIQGTNLYLTMLYSRDLLWVPGDCFTAGPAPRPADNAGEDVDSDGLTNSESEQRASQGSHSVLPRLASAPQACIARQSQVLQAKLMQLPTPRG